MARDLGPGGNVASSADGKRLATTAGPTIKLWDTTTGREVFTLHGHTAGVYCLAFSPGASGDGLVSGSIDYTARVWDATPLTADAQREWEAGWLVIRLFLQFPLKSELVEHLRNDPDLDEPLRAAALDAAERLRWNQPTRLATAMPRSPITPMARVGTTSGPCGWPRRGPIEPETPCSGPGPAPPSTGPASTRGPGPLRWADMHRQATIPATGAFLAMTYHRLGQHTEARAPPGPDARGAASYRQADNPSIQEILHELEALLSSRGRLSKPALTAAASEAATATCCRVGGQLGPTGAYSRSEWIGERNGCPDHACGSGRIAIPSRRALQSGASLSNRFPNRVSGRSAAWLSSLSWPESPSKPPSPGGQRQGRLPQ